MSTLSLNSLQPPLLPSVHGLDVLGRDGEGQHEVVRLGLEFCVTLSVEVGQAGQAAVVERHPVFLVRKVDLAQAPVVKVYF